MKTNLKALKIMFNFCPNYYIAMIFKNIFSSLIPYVNLYMSAKILNEIAEERNIQKSIFFVIITIATNLIISVAENFMNKKCSETENIIKDKENIFLNEKAFELDYAMIENPEIIWLRNEIKNAVASCHGTFVLKYGLSDLFNSIINLILSVGLFSEMFILVSKNKFNIISGGLFGTIIVLIIGSVIYSFYTEKIYSKQAGFLAKSMTESDMINNAFDSYNIGKDIRLYNQESIILKIKAKIANTRKKAQTKDNNVYFATQTINILLMCSMKAITYIYICIYAIQGFIGIGSVLKYVGCLERIIDSVIYMFRGVSSIKHNTAFLEQYLQFIDIKSDMASGNKKLSDIDLSNYEFELKNVSFKYPGSDFYALKNVSLKIKSGRHLAVVGMNGSGKTTFIKLLCRLYNPTDGEILLNGINIKEYNYGEYLKIFSIVFQDFKIFPFSLGENVASEESYDKSLVIKKLKQSGINTKKIPLETYLYKDFDELGIEISGGEAQKIAIARALYKDSPCIILDEPTAALDPIAEFEVYSNFNEMVKNKTVVYISHRLSSCRFCDNIAVFNEGELIQYGNYDTLVSDENGKYYELWNSQAQYYK